MNIGFEFILRETAIGGDAKASMQMIEMERKHKKEMCEIMDRLDRMETIIEKQASMIENFGYIKLNDCPIHATDIIINPGELPESSIAYYNCKKLTITPHHVKNLSRYKNMSVEHLLINHIYGLNSTNSISYDGIQNMPSLKQFNITTTYTHKNIEGLIEKSIFVVEINNIANILSSYNHSISEINLVIKLNIDNGNNTLPTPLDMKWFSGLQTYCKKNNIDLIVQ